MITLYVLKAQQDFNFATLKISHFAWVTLRFLCHSTPPLGCQALGLLRHYMIAGKFGLDNLFWRIQKAFGFQWYAALKHNQRAESAISKHLPDEWIAKEQREK